jgi:hypothetical protein
MPGLVPGGQVTTIGPDGVIAWNCPPSATPSGMTTDNMLIVAGRLHTMGRSVLRSRNVMKSKPTPMTDAPINRDAQQPIPTAIVIVWQSPGICQYRNIRRTTSPILHRIRRNTCVLTAGHIRVPHTRRASGRGRASLSSTSRGLTLCDSARSRSRVPVRARELFTSWSLFACRD